MDSLTLQYKAKIATLEASLKEAVDMLKEAHDHLEYCGYGDKWERECAREDKLDERIVSVLQKYSEKELAKTRLAPVPSPNKSN